MRHRNSLVPVLLVAGVWITSSLVPVLGGARAPGESEDLPPNLAKAVRAYIEAEKAATAAAIEKLDQWVKDDRKHRQEIRERYKGKSYVRTRADAEQNRKAQEERRKAYQELDQKRREVIDTLARLRQGKATVKPEFSYTGIRVGLIGRLVSTLRVLQVIDASNFLGIACSPMASLRLQPIWVSGLSTENLVDDKTVGIPYCLWVQGTTKYRTLLGTKTVFKLRVVDIEALKKAVQKLR